MLFINSATGGITVTGGNITILPDYKLNIYKGENLTLDDFVTLTNDGEINNYSMLFDTTSWNRKINDYTTADVTVASKSRIR